MNDSCMNLCCPSLALVARLFFVFKMFIFVIGCVGCFLDLSCSC